MTDRGQRVDKWLWFARFAKTRGLAQTLIEEGAVRINRMKVARASHEVTPGDVLTIAVHQRIRVVKVVATGLRRGPASEARMLYEDLAEPAAERRRMPNGQ